MSSTKAKKMTTKSSNSSQGEGTMADKEPRLHAVNETGYVQELERNFSLFSICSVGIVTGATWPALGGSIVVAIYNGGPSGVIYEFIAVSIFYWLVAASLAELASSMPSSAGVYYWASITPGPKWGRVCGWFAGWWNTFAWILATATMSSISSQIAVAMYGVYHPEYYPERWHIFVGYLITTWTCCSVVLFANKALPMVNNIGLIFILGGVFATIVVCAVMPGVSGWGYATSSFVWSDWFNNTGYSNNSFVFLAGMLNGAYAVGTPDCVSHLAEEIPNPKRNIPLAIAAQMAIGFITALGYMVAIFYSINDLGTILDISYFPLAGIYAQASSSTAGTIGLLVIIFVPIYCCCIGTYITAGRTLWTIARDKAVPYSSNLGVVSPRFSCPFNATLFCGIFSTILGLIYVASSTAFNAFIGSFIVLSTLSYLAAILPFIFTRRFSRANSPPGPYVNSIRPGPYSMGHKLGYAANIISCLYISFFIIIYSFPATLPVSPSTMNYTCLITGSISFFAAGWWLKNGKDYVGPKALVQHDEIDGEVIELSACCHGLPSLAIGKKVEMVESSETLENPYSSRFIWDSWSNAVRSCSRCLPF